MPTSQSQFALKFEWVTPQCSVAQRLSNDWSVQLTALSTDPDLVQILLAEHGVNAAWLQAMAAIIFGDRLYSLAGVLFHTYHGCSQLLTNWQ